MTGYSHLVPDGPVNQPPGGFVPAPDQEAVLLEALATAGVELGTYDMTILRWIANYEWSTVATVTSWIARAWQSTEDQWGTDLTCGCPEDYHLHDCPTRRPSIDPDPGDITDALYAQDEDNGCEGHASLEGAHMGEAIYCDGTCLR